MKCCAVQEYECNRESFCLGLSVKSLTTKDQKEVSAISSCLFLCMNASIFLPQEEVWTCLHEFGKGFQTLSTETKHFHPPPPLHKGESSQELSMYCFLQGTVRICWLLGIFLHIKFFWHGFLSLLMFCEGVGSHYSWITAHSSSTWNSWVERTAVDTSVII